MADAGFAEDPHVGLDRKHGAGGDSLVGFDEYPESAHIQSACLQNLATLTVLPAETNFALHGFTLVQALAGAILGSVEIGLFWRWVHVPTTIVNAGNPASNVVFG